jgi:uncharacterized lipoprotein YddW (UPF0748 family)
LDWPKHTTSNAEIQQKELTSILDKLKAANFNTIFFQVRLRGDVIYNSRYEPVNRSIAFSNGYDPLAFAIEECHKRGLELHAWFTPYNLGNNQKSPTISNNANIVKPSKSSNPKKEYFFDPGEPQTNKYLLSLIIELVANYDIDGFHFDRIRYPDSGEDFDDYQTFKKYSRGQNTRSWRRENINTFVYAVYDAIKAIKPWVQVSSAVVGVYSKLPSVRRSYLKAYDDACQDPADWMRKGKHDFIVPMMYFSNDLFLPALDNWIDYSYGRFVVPGLGIFKLDENEGNWPPEWITRQIQYSRTIRAQGNAFYRTLFLTENKKGVMDELTRNYYRNPALLYPLKWLKSTSPSPPVDPEFIRTASSVRLQWKNLEQNNNEKVFYNVYCSPSSPVDTSNPKNLIATRLEDTSLPVKNPIGYYYVITTYDRYHNESISSKEIHMNYQVSNP